MIRRLILCLFISSASAAEEPAQVTVTLSKDQAQIILNLIQADIVRSCDRGNCWAAAKVLGPVIESILEGAKKSNGPSDR